MAKCSKCNQDKPDSEFNFNKSKGRLEYHCKKCHSDYLKSHYARNKEYYKNKARNHEFAIKQWLSDLKCSLKCEICSESHPSCLDFHHEDRTLKEHNISKMASLGKSKEAIQNEISKCQVLCSNCHRKLHWEERCPMGVMEARHSTKV